MTTQFIIAILFIGLTSCQSLYNQTTYAKTSASGSISDDEWKYLYGYTDPQAKKPDGIEHIVVLLAYKPKDPCPTELDPLKDLREVVLGIDGKSGEMHIGGRTGQYETSEDVFTYSRPKRSGTVAFVNPAKAPAKQYQFAATGKIKITKITKDTIEGLVLAKLNPEHYVNGRFKAKICPRIPQI